MIKGPTEPTKEQALNSFKALYPTKPAKAVRDLTGWYGYFQDEPEVVPVNKPKFPMMTPDEMLVRK